MNSGGQQYKGFTIVELLIVIVVIAVLAVVTLFAMTELRERAENSKVAADVAVLTKAVIAARNNEQKSLNAVTENYNYGWGGAAAACSGKPGGTNLAALPKTDSCWVAYNQALDKISTASGINVRGIVDPLGRPYSIDEEEIPGQCAARDRVYGFSRVYAGWGGFWPNSTNILPKSGFVAGC